MKILLIEDEHKIANAVKVGLQQENFVVDVCYDGTTGYDLASSESYDVIVLDRLLPGMDGVEICKTLRKNNNHVSILMLTAKGQIADRVEGLNSGADDYLTKPFSFEELIARVRALSRRPQEITNTVLSVDNLSLNTATFEVSRGGKQIKLSAKEFALLEYLLKNSGKIVTKNQIISHVWSYDANILPNTLEVFIGYLRTKIDRNFPKEKPLLKTARGFGYRIG